MQGPALYAAGMQLDTSERGAISDRGDPQELLGMHKRDQGRDTHQTIVGRQGTVGGQQKGAYQQANEVNDGDKNRVSECGGGNKQQHAWWEECRQREVDIIFVGKCSIPKNGLGTINMLEYELVTEGKAGMRVVAYWRQGMRNGCEVVMDEVDAIGIKWQGRRIVRVYSRGRVEGGSKKYDAWVKRVTSVLRRSDGILLGDWNAHHQKWSLKVKRDAGGVALDEAMLEVGAEWWKTTGLTWERMVSGRHVKSRIDLVFYEGEEMVRKVKKVKRVFDH